jgi:hypothetical protein
MNYTSRENIRRLVAHDQPARMGFDFHSLSDLTFVGSRNYVNVPPNPYDGWGMYPELQKKSGFHGETRMDMHGNIYGRFEGKTKGECVRGVIQDWEDYQFFLPDFAPNHRDYLKSLNLADADRYVLTWGNSLFSTLRDARLMPNALADTILDPEAVVAFIDRLAEHEVAIIKSIAVRGEPFIQKIALRIS